jgi:hypothetical protein
MPLRGLSTLRIFDYKRKMEWLTRWFGFWSIVRVRPLGRGQEFAKTLHSRSVTYSPGEKESDFGYTING